MTLRPLMCRFSDAGKGDSPRAPAAGVRKAPRHEIAVGWAPGGAAGSIYGGARAQARFHRIAQLKSLAEQAGERDFNPVELMRGRAEALAQRGTNMKRLADAWQPLYQTLNPEQKQRMRLLAMHVVRDVKGAIERHRMSEMMSDPEEGDED